MARLPQDHKQEDYERQPGLFGSVLPRATSTPPIKFTSKLTDYLLDILGVIVIAIGILLLIGSMGITKGAFIGPIVKLITRWFGIGKFFIALSLILLGIVLIRWQKVDRNKLKLGSILKFEVAGFLILGILSIASGKNIFLDETGADPGGIIGWGVAEIFSIPLGKVGALIFLIILSMGCSASSLGLFKKTHLLVKKQLGEYIHEDSPVIDTSPVGFQKVGVENLDITQEEVFVRKAPTRTLPPEFRKSFKVNLPENSEPVKLAARAITLPPINLLEEEKSYNPDKHTINMTAGLIEKTLAEFGIPAKVVGFRAGPTVIQYAVEPGYFEKGKSDARYKIRVSQISNLKRDLKLALRAERLRIEAPVPGKSYVGIEVPNSKTSIVHLRSLIESGEFSSIKSKLAIPIGKDVSGKPIAADLGAMPHLLIAGTTGSGKSVCIAAIATCLVMNNAPETLRLVMIDPKLVELIRFNGLPHLLGEVEVEVKRILAVLRWATSEMDYRYELLRSVGAKEIDGYNAKMRKRNQATLPRVVIMIDELADLMMTAKEETEKALVRLAQKARAIGIHLVIATQRPSIDVVTGVIKANFPTRISFTVASSIDSRVILDVSGAETLLGKGDMLYLNPEIGLPLRSQGVMVSDREMERVVKWWQAEDAANHQTEVSEPAPWEEAILEKSEDNEDDDLINQAVEILRKDGKASASYLQRQLRIGYPRAARLMDQLEERGIIGPSQSGGRDRDILLDDDVE